MLGGRMTGPHAAELLSLATPYALHALSDAEAADVERLLDDAPPDVADAFHTEVQAVRETMAALASATAVEPPPELRADLLALKTNAGEVLRRDLPNPKSFGLFLHENQHWPRAADC